MKQADRRFDWSTDAAEIVRRIRAADSSPGVRAFVDGREVSLYDAAAGPLPPGTHRPGSLVGHRDDAIAVAAGDAAVWIGQVKEPANTGGRGVKLPATDVFDVSGLAELDLPDDLRQTSYVRQDGVGMLTIRVYNGAMSTKQCDRVLVALDEALRQDTRVLVVRGTSSFFSNGINLNVIDVADDPAAEAWDNINAINRLCTALVSCADQLTISAFTANAGAGGVMFGLAADVVAARDGVVLNPYYDMGLYGSELHTYTLPRRVGAPTASRLLREKLPVDARDGARIGLVDAVGPRAEDAFEDWLWNLARSYANPQWHSATLSAKQTLLAAAYPPAFYAAHELSEMAYDFFEDRSGFAEARRAFVSKRDPERTPEKLSGAPRPLAASLV